MKVFILVPTYDRATHNDAPSKLIACDYEDYAAKSRAIEHYSAYLYSDEDMKAVEALEYGQTFIDGQGWRWERVA